MGGSEKGLGPFWSDPFRKVGAFFGVDVFVSCCSVCWCVLEWFLSWEVYFLKNRSGAGRVPGVTPGSNIRGQEGFVSGRDSSTYVGGSWAGRKTVLVRFGAVVSEK